MILQGEIATPVLFLLHVLTYFIYQLCFYFACFFLHINTHIHKYVALAPNPIYDLESPM